MLPFSGVVEVDEEYGYLYEVALDVFQKEIKEESGKDVSLDDLVFSLYRTADCDTEDVITDSQDNVWITRSGMIKIAMVVNEESDRVDCIRLMQGFGISLTLDEELRIIFR